MERISIYTDDEHGDKEFIGWFDKDAAEEVASYTKGDLYKNGKILLATAGGKFIVNSWDNQGFDVYRSADDEAEIAEILCEHGYSSDEKRLIEVLDKFKI